MSRLEIEDQLGPEQSAHGGVRTRLWRLGVERRQQRQDGDEVTAPVSHPAAERLQIPQLAERATARRAEGGEMRPDPPAAVRSRATPCLNGSGNHGAGL